MKSTIDEYLDLFGELPKIPIMCSLSQIEDLMRDAIISGVKLSQEEVNEFFKHMDESYDIDV